MIEQSRRLKEELERQRRELQDQLRHLSLVYDSITNHDSPTASKNAARPSADFNRELH